jgi:hypothetical protein
MNGKRFHVGAIAALALLVLLPAAALAGDQKLKKEEVPETVLKAFERAYPFAKATAYERDDKGGVAYYEIECRIGSLKLELVYSGDGDLYEIEQVVAMKTVPKAVAKSAKQAHPKAKIKSAEKLTRGDQTLYEFHMVEGKKKFEVVLDSAGKILEPEGEKDEADEGKAEDD